MAVHFRPFIIRCKLFFFNYNGLLMIFSFLRSLLRENVKMADILQSKLDDRMIRQLLNSVRLQQNIVICQCLADCLRLRQMIYLLAKYEHDILLNLVQLLLIIIRCKFFFPFIVRKPITWPVNKFLQIMVCSCAMSSNCIWLQIIFCSCVNERTLSPSCDRSCVKMAPSPRYLISKNKLGDWIIKQLLNSVIHC